MRKPILIAVVICAVIGEGWAQNRGSSRYAPPEDYEGDITRAPRPSPTRGSRRHRPATHPEAVAVDEPDSSIRGDTTARRVLQRTRTHQVVPPVPPLPVEPVRLHESSVEDLPQSPPVEPESRPQGKRRRRPKKRRKPEAATVAEEPPKDGLLIPELINNERKRTDEFHGDPHLRNSPSHFGPDPNFEPDKSSWGTHGSSPAEQPQSNAAGSQYFKPQQATNRLPVDEPEPIDNTGRYIQPPPADTNAGDTGAYVPKTYSPNEASYVPVLNPVRVPSEGSSRFPPENYQAIRNQDSTRETLPLDHNTPHRSHSNTYSGPDPNDILNTGTKPIQNVIVQPNESGIPVRGNSEVRLPPDQRPLLSPEYTPSNYDSAEDNGASLQSNPKTTDEEDKPASPSNRLPNPSEVHYDSVYPEFSDTHQDSSRRFAGRRQEQAERNSPQSFTSARRNSGTKPQEYDNDAEVDRRQASQYQPPLQRGGSRYKPDDGDSSPRSRVPQDVPSTSTPRSRGSSRYQSPESTPDRTRGSSRHIPEPHSDSSSRLRERQASSTRESAPRGREPQRYVPETADDVPRQSTRRQPSSSQPIHKDTDYGRPASSYVPIEEILNAEQRTPSNPARAVRQPSENPRNVNEEDDYAPVRHTLRSRPQFDVRDAGPAHSYEESAEDTYGYDPEYAPPPREPNTRSRTNQRTPVVRQQPPPQPEYQAPQNRQPNRQPSQYETPQNPRYRHPPQYQESQNLRADARHAGSRQQEPESRSRSPAAASRFQCPQPYGFFPDLVQCDKYYECHNGTAEMSLCSDGLAFNEISSPKFLRCDSLRDVDCHSRPELQEAHPSGNCPRRFGLFPHETDCTKFWNCVDGAATEVQCPPGLTYNDERATCDWADLVETTCKSEDLLGFKCPEPTSHDLLEGVYSKYPHPTNCQKHFICIKGADGLRRPRMLSCNEGLVYNPSTKACVIPHDVPGCEDFYGERSDPPKRKPPPRQPAPVEPEEEYIEEEPTPRPRRRGSSRRSRN